MAQLTNEQWSRMTQEERDAHLRGLVSYGKTVTGRRTVPEAFDPYATATFACLAEGMKDKHALEIIAALRAVDAVTGSDTFGNLDRLCADLSGEG